jgi:hypothetical protein
VFVSDVVANGQLLTCEEIQNKIESKKLLTVFEYNILSNACKDKIPHNKICPNRDFTIYLEQRPLETLSTKEIRNFVVRNRLAGKEDDYTKIWKHKYGDNAINKSSWLLAKSVSKETRLIALQWKILHNIYPTKI